MDEEDRQRAIESIERHQRTLERQQASLSVLLDSAITFLRGLDTAVPAELADTPQASQVIPGAPYALAGHVLPGAPQVFHGTPQPPQVLHAEHQAFPQTHQAVAYQALPAPPPRAFIPTATLSAVTAAAAAAQARRQPDEDESIES